MYFLCVLHSIIDTVTKKKVLLSFVNTYTQRSNWNWGEGRNANSHICLKIIKLNKDLKYGEHKYKYK